MSRIYLDYNSTTPCLPEVVEAMRPYFDSTFGNPASAHRTGAAARRALEEARTTIADCLGASPDEVYFTSGATEANNLALFGLPTTPGEIITSPVEHPSITEPLSELAERGYQIRPLAVDTIGRVAPDQMRTSAETRLITIQLANHETGTVQSIAALAGTAPGVPFHTDATQAVGKIPVNFHKLGVTTLACSAHKLHGPKGIGALLVKAGTRFRPLIFGGHQQQALRPGTEPVALAVGFATALRLAVDHLEERRGRVERSHRRLLVQLNQNAQPHRINGDPHVLPHTLNVSFPGCPSDLLLIRLDLAGIDCSTGSACSSGSLLPSPVLQAMNCPPECLRSAMRFSFSYLTTDEEIDEAGRLIAREVNALRSKK
jgi:cysteine desulfurase